MVHTIIFSFDRAIQLELLLKSIITHDSDGILDTSILYSFTSDTHQESYQVLIHRYPQFNWVQEKRFPKKTVKPLFPAYWHNYYWWIRYRHNRTISSNFRKQLLNIVQDNKCEVVMFLTDDSMFFNRINVSAYPLKQIRENPHTSSFSLRHGSNIMGGNYSAINGLLYWNIFDKQEHPEWSFPFSIDGHIYNKEFIYTTFSKVWFKNPNTLEGNVACYIREKAILPTVYSNIESCLVGFELNRVQTVSNNNNLNISSQYLNYLFHKGYEMSISFDRQNNRFFRPDKFRVDALKENYAINIITLDENK